MGRTLTNGIGRVAGAVLLVVAGVAVWRYAEWWSAQVVHPDLHVSHWLLDVGVSVVIGRIALSLLPAGPVGSHRLRDLPLTLATSFALGFWIAEVQREVFGLDDTRGILLPWTIPLALRLVTLPGAMVPRHDTPAEAPSRLAQSLWILSVVWGAALVALAIHLAIDAFLAIAMGLLALVLIDHAWSQSRCAPTGRALLVALAAFGAFIVPDLGGVGLHPVAGVCFLVPWLRRADRRSCWLAASSFAISAGGSTALACTGFAVLLFASTRAQRHEAFVAILVVTALLTIPIEVAKNRDAIAAPLAAYAVVLLAARTSLLVRPLQLDAWFDVRMRIRFALIAFLAVAVLTTPLEAWLPVALLLAGLELIPADRAYETNLRST